MKNKKAFNLIYCLLVISICFCTSKVNAASNPYNQYFKNDINCTWYTWKIVYERTGIVLPAWGDAKDWYSAAQKAGYSVGTTPKANSVAIWTKCDGDCATYGHVGYLERVDSNGSLYIKDSSEAGMNGCPDYENATYKECIANGVSEETDKICAENAPRKTCAFSPLGDWQVPGFYTGDITQFIYLDNAPKNPPAVTNEQPSNNNQDTKPQKTAKNEDKKSGNTNLKNIELSVGSIEFSNDVNDYHLEVEHDTKTITISAEPEDDKATVTGTGEHDLLTGNNLIKIKVTAEDNTEKAFKIIIVRKGLEEKEIEEDNKEEEAKGETTEVKKSNKLLIIITTITILIIISIISFIFLKRKKLKNKRSVKA